MPNLPNGPWLGTNSGKMIDLLNPDPEQITLDDIATGLSNLCRFNGQIKQFYSVAEHCIHAAQLVPAGHRLQALLHDATEAYICDIPTPLKRLLGAAYYDVEARLAKAIGDKWAIELVDLHPVVKQADRIMLVTEHDYLQEIYLDWGPEYDGVIRYPDWTPVGTGRSNKWVAEEYKHLFHKYAVETM